VPLIVLLSVCCHQVWQVLHAAEQYTGLFHLPHTDAAALGGGLPRLRWLLLNGEDKVLLEAAPSGAGALQL